ncbi:hypothetical protein A3J78_00180 [Candidatus Beckwithbacteria bacterium RBG_13_35_6]|uniref:Uncharacterized protein n=1 Tax=Candidatus Beckwithbacteria bacterium RBG_13_35_6 TaxID=1797456 RepID=A0A1F5DE32_9BACT|nr:MAG: hypothetical protein A3J78_00180 [Candidatus Beckwithbacteria bacterium RBG_13_35_6]
MIPIEELLNKLLNVEIWSVVKVLFLLALGLYLLFALMIIKEVDLMSKTIKGVFNLPLKLIAFLHFCLSVAVFILAFVIL